MNRTLDKWYLDPKFLADDARVSDTRRPTGTVIFRKRPAGKIEESLSFNDVIPAVWSGIDAEGAPLQWDNQNESSAELDLSFEYNGYYPIQIRGLYLTPIPGSSAITTEASSEEAIRKILVLGRDRLLQRHGLHLGYVSYSTDENGIVTQSWVYKTFSYGSNGGSGPGEPIAIELHPEMPSPDILTPGDKVEFKLIFNAPRAGEFREIEAATLLNFGIELSYIEITPDMNLDPLSWSSENCGA